MIDLLSQRLITYFRDLSTGIDFRELKILFTYLLIGRETSL